MRNFLLLFALIGISTADSFGAAIPSLYWSEPTGIYRTHVDGSEVNFVTGGFEIGGLALDRPRDQLFFSDILPLGGPGPAGGIFRGTNDGENISPIITGLTAPSAVALDRNAGHIIWSDRELSSISVAGYDGGDLHTILEPEPSIAQIAGLAFDPWERKLYFSFVNPLIDSLRPGGIARMNLEGGDFEVVVTGLVSPQGVAVDHVRKSVYWADPEFGIGMIGMADFDGVKADLVTDLDEPRGVAVDPFLNLLYWADAGTGKIQRSDHYASQQDIVIGRNRPNAVGLLSRVGLPSAFILPGDTNDDGLVDLYDLNEVRNHFGQVAGAGPGDSDVDGDVDLDDLNAVRNNFGTRFNPPTGLTSVPEPSSAILGACLVVGVTVLARRARKSPTSVRR